MFVIGESKRKLIYVPQIAFLYGPHVAIGINMATHKKKAFYDVSYLLVVNSLSHSKCIQYEFQSLYPKNE